MNWRVLFNRPPRFIVDPLLGEGNKTPSEASFLSVQALVTFSGASFAITILRAAVESLDSDLSGSKLLGLGLAFSVGTVIWIIGVTDPETHLTGRDKLIGFFLAVLNSCTLYLASQGLLGQLAGHAAPTSTTQ